MLFCVSTTDYGLFEPFTAGYTAERGKHKKNEQGRQVVRAETSLDSEGTSGQNGLLMNQIKTKTNYPENCMARQDNPCEKMPPRIVRSGSRVCTGSPSIVQ